MIDGFVGDYARPEYVTIGNRLFNGRYEHIAYLLTAYGRVKVLAICNAHDEPISFLDCPVASRWTLVRANTPQHDYNMPHNALTGECPPNCPARKK